MRGGSTYQTDDADVDPSIDWRMRMSNRSDDSEVDQFSSRWRQEGETNSKYREEQGLYGSVNYKEDN